MPLDDALKIADLGTQTMVHNAAAVEDFRRDGTPERPLTRLPNNQEAFPKDSVSTMTSMAIMQNVA